MNGNSSLEIVIGQRELGCSAVALNGLCAASALSQFKIRVVILAGFHALACFFSLKAVHQHADAPKFPTVPEL
jgi:hypothetical protein